MERKWIIASFGDIRGFGTWEYRAATTPEIKEPFILKFYETMQSYLRKHNDIHFKYGGDGFLVIREFNNKKKLTSEVYDHLNGLKCLTNKSKEDIRSVIYPSLEGFRIRHFEGHAYKLKVIDPNDPNRIRMTEEFVGYVINAARRLLDVNPEINCLATEGIAKVLGKKNGCFKIKPLGKPSHYPRSVNREDIESLQILRW